MCRDRGGRKWGQFSGAKDRSNARIAGAYRALVEQAGSADQIVVSSESAGGNLAIELLIDGQAHADPAISAQAIRTRAADYLAGTDPADPLVSPSSPTSGLPPLLIQAGSHEVRLDDATRLAAKAAADDVAVILDITPRGPARLPGLRRPPRRRRRRPQPGRPVHPGQHRSDGCRLTSAISPQRNLRDRAPASSASC